jgi:hypothetical protein
MLHGHKMALFLLEEEYPTIDILGVNNVLIKKILRIGILEHMANIANFDLRTSDDGHLKQTYMTKELTSDSYAMAIEYKLIAQFYHGGPRCNYTDEHT